MKYKNALLINKFLCLLKLKRWGDVVDKLDLIEKSEQVLDQDEKNLKRIYLFAREKLKQADLQKYEAHLKGLVDQTSKDVTIEDEQKRAGMD